MEGERIIPRPLAEWPTYGDFDRSGGFDALVAACRAGPVPSPGPFLPARTDHLVAEKVLVRTVVTQERVAVWCHAGLDRSEGIVRDLGLRLGDALQSWPEVTTEGHWIVYTWTSAALRQQGSDP